MTASTRTVILVSGNGSNLQAIIDACQQQRCHATVVGVISNNANAYALQRAQAAQIPTAYVDHRTYATREEFDQTLQLTIDTYASDLIVLAGFMRILTPTFVRHYAGRLLNIHPSLLPKYRGLHTHQRALDAGDSEHGSTVHFVTEELDGGPLIAQARIQICADDTAATLATKTQTREHQLYPRVIDWYAQGRLHLVNQHVVFDQQRLSQPLNLDTVNP
ncbi:MAG: phosphoribosylglycinamide formyltransferase [Gammaproteobacteria bacterium]|nr:phosphoribosylglycinamide formyltransferase [Gammaproteobacteria bacterium]